MFAVTLALLQDSRAGYVTAAVPNRENTEYYVNFSHNHESLTRSWRNLEEIYF